MSAEYSISHELMRHVIQINITRFNTRDYHNFYCDRMIKCCPDDFFRVELACGHVRYVRQLVPVCRSLSGLIVWKAFLESVFMSYWTSPTLMVASFYSPCCGVCETNDSLFWSCYLFCNHRTNSESGFMQSTASRFSLLYLYIYTCEHLVVIGFASLGRKYVAKWIHTVTVTAPTSQLHVCDPIPLHSFWKYKWSWTFSIMNRRRFGCGSYGVPAGVG